MPEAGVSTRARRRYAAPWSEELDSDAFRFPTGYGFPTGHGVKRAVAARGPLPARAPAPVAAAPLASAPAAPTPTSAPVRSAPTSTPARSAPTSAPAPPARPAATSEAQVADGGRRTVVIRGRGAERNLAVARPTLRRHERPGFKADRAALWAVVLGLLLILVAAASAHAAVLH